MLGTAAVAGAAIYGTIELMKAAADLLGGQLTNDLAKDGTAATVTAMDQTTEAGKAANEQLSKYNELIAAIKNPVNTTTDTQGKVDLWTPIFTQDVRDELFGGLEVEQLVGDNMLASFINAYKVKLESDIKLATTEAAATGIGPGLTSGLKEARRRKQQRWGWQRRWTAPLPAPWALKAHQLSSCNMDWIRCLERRSASSKVCRLRWAR